MKLHRDSHLSGVEPRTGRLACRFATAAILISSLVAPPLSHACYTRTDTMKEFMGQRGGAAGALFGQKGGDMGAKKAEKKADTQTVTAGDYVVVTATAPATGQPTGTCYGLNIAKVTKDGVEFYIETAVMGEIKCDKKLKRVKFGEQGNFSGFIVKAERGDSTGTAKLIFGCPGC